MNGTILVAKELSACETFSVLVHEFAHELLHLAAEHGLRNQLKERLLHAYFEEGRSVFDVDALVPFAVEVGLDEAEVREALEDRRYLAAVREDGTTAQSLGATLHETAIGFKPMKTDSYYVTVYAAKLKKAAEKGAVSMAVAFR